MQLVAVGVQDAFLSGTPEVTFLNLDTVVTPTLQLNVSKIVSMVLLI